MEIPIGADGRLRLPSLRRVQEGLRRRLAERLG
jgi:hypothetical protein